MTPQNEPPKIPSLKPVQKDEEKKSGSGPLASTGKAPTSTGFRFPGLGKGGLPNLRVRGLPSGTSVIDRLKNLRKKDMMFILAGLAVLCMAPLAEHFMMSPEEEAGKLQEGFDSKGPLFPDGSTVYESGTGGFSPGGLVGAGTDVITPLNVRDPSALVMGPGATRKPEAVVTPPPAAPEKPEPATDWKHALAESAKSGAKAAVSKAKLPMPNVKMSGALRGLSAGGGGTSASLSLAGLSAGNVPNKARDSNSLTTSKAAPGYRGASKRSTDMATGAEGLKNAGNRAGDILNRGGNAAGNLENAAKEAIPGSGGSGTGSGNPTKDADGKSTSHKRPDDNKSLGESLEALRQKTDMQKSLELKWKKKEWEQFGRGKMIEESVIKLALDNFLGKGIFEPIGQAIGKTFTQTMAGGAGKTTYYRCLDSSGKAAIYDEGQVLEQVGTTGLRLKSDVSKEGNVIQCPGGVEVIGPGSTGKPPVEPSDQAPSSLNGVNGGFKPVPDESGNVARDLNAALTLHCGPNASDKWGDGTNGICKAMASMKVTAESTFKKVQDQTQSAREKVDKAYPEMLNIINFLGTDKTANTTMKSLADTKPVLFNGLKKDGVLAKSGDSAAKFKEVADATNESNAETVKSAYAAGKDLIQADDNSVKKALVTGVGPLGESGFPTKVAGSMQVAGDNIAKVQKSWEAVKTLLDEADKALDDKQGARKDLNAARQEILTARGETIDSKSQGGQTLSGARDTFAGQLDGSVARLEGSIKDTEQLVATAKKVLNESVEKGAAFPVYGEKVDGNAGVYKKVVEAAGVGKEIADIKIKTDTEVLAQTPAPESTVPMNTPIEKYKAAAAEVTTAMTPLTKKLTPLEEPIGTAITKAGETIATAKTQVENRGGTGKSPAVTGTVKK